MRKSARESRRATSGETARERCGFVKESAVDANAHGTGIFAGAQREWLAAGKSSVHFAPTQECVDAALIVELWTPRADRVAGFFLSAAAAPDLACRRRGGKEAQPCGTGREQYLLTL